MFTQHFTFRPGLKILLFQVWKVDADMNHCLVPLLMSLPEQPELYRKMPTRSFDTVVVALIIVFLHLRRTIFYFSTLFDCETESRRKMLDVLVLSSGLSGCAVLFSISKVQTCSPAAWSQWIRPTRGSSSCVCLCLGFFSNLIFGNLGLEFVVCRMWDECDLQASQVQFDRSSERIISILLGSPSSCSFSGPTGPLLLI